MRRFLGLLFLGLLWSGYAHAQSAGCPNPNPNLSAWATLTGPNFQGLDSAPSVNCPLPASGLNGAFSNLGTNVTTLNTTVATLAPKISPAFTVSATVTGTQAGAQTADAAVLTTLQNSTTTANQIYRWIVCAAACSGAGTAVDDAIRGIAVNASGSNVLINGITGYALNNNPAGLSPGQTAVVGAYGIGAVAGSATWGFDSILSDNQYLSLTGAHGSTTYLYNEFDFAITSTFTQASGLQVGGTFIAQPAAANGFYVETPWGSSLSGPSSPFAKWSFGLITQGGCCTTGISLGTKTFTLTANDPGQPIILNYVDGTPAVQNEVITASGGNLNIGGSAKWGILLNNGSGNTNGLQLGALATSGTNIASQNLLWGFFGGAGTFQNYAANVTTGGALNFASTLTNPTYNFNGQINIPNASGAPSNNALIIGAQAASGANTPSYFQLFGYFDSGGVAQNYSIVVSAAQVLTIQGSAAAASQSISMTAQTITLPNLPTQAHAGSNACVGYNASTKQLYISSTITTC